MKRLRVSGKTCRSVFLIWLIVSFLGVNCFLPWKRPVPLP